MSKFPAFCTVIMVQNRNYCYTPYIHTLSYNRTPYRYRIGATLIVLCPKVVSKARACAPCSRFVTSNVGYFPSGIASFITDIAGFITHGYLWAIFGLLFVGSAMLGQAGLRARSHFEQKDCPQGLCWAKGWSQGRDWYWRHCHWSTSWGKGGSCL